MTCSRINYGHVQNGNVSESENSAYYRELNLREGSHEEPLEGSLVFKLRI